MSSEIHVNNQVSARAPCVTAIIAFANGCGLQSPVASRQSPVSGLHSHTQTHSDPVGRSKVSAAQSQKNSRMKPYLREGSLKGIKGRGWAGNQSAVASRQSPVASRQ